MTPALEPELALRYLAALSTDVLDAVVLAPDGATLAGDASLAARATALAQGAEAGAARRAPAPPGTLVAMRGANRVVAVHAGPHALASVLVEDLRTVLGAGGSPVGRGH